MRVICIDATNSQLKEGEAYSATRKGKNHYELVSHLGIFYKRSRFIATSAVDESKFNRNYRFKKV